MPEKKKIIEPTYGPAFRYDSIVACAAAAAD